MNWVFELVAFAFDGALSGAMRDPPYPLCKRQQPRPRLELAKENTGTPMLKAIFFDFNGVIIDDETIQMEAYREVLRGHDIELTKAWYMDALGMDDRTFV